MAFSDEVKRRIVVELASFRSTMEVRDILKREYEIEARPNDLCRYDATKDYFVGGAALAELFNDMRRRFIRDVSDIAIASMGYRLRRLERMSETLERIGQYKLAAALLEQAAKELGGYHVRLRPGPEGEVRMSPAESRSRMYAYADREVERRLALREPPKGDESAEPPAGAGDPGAPADAAEPWPSEAALKAHAACVAMTLDERNRAQAFGDPEREGGFIPAPARDGPPDPPDEPDPDRDVGPDPAVDPVQDARDAEDALRDRVAGAVDYGRDYGAQGASG